MYIRNDDVILSLAKIFGTRIIVGVQYSLHDLNEYSHKKLTNLIGY